jgi:hypothetical protein
MHFMKSRPRNNPERRGKTVDERVVWALTGVVAFTIAAAVPAQTPSKHIFKCMQGETIAYQSMPCGLGQTEVRVLTMGPAEADVPPPASVATPRLAPAADVPTGESKGKTWPPRRTLTLGMSDDEVLNLAGWGVPTRIARSRTARGWREEWTYETSAGERRLYFVNTTLVDAIVGDDPPAMAQVEPVRRGYPAS